jgi:hypothetical protein
LLWNKAKWRNYTGKSYTNKIIPLIDEEIGEELLWMHNGARTPTSPD